ncbi:MAG TPA: S8 family serine peptidase [Pseudonocardiaceae bacterium]|nr:S8 family serine peptidase [Pseudonocardiaceae bacterium]
MPLLRRAKAAAIGTALLATGCLAIPALAHADPGQATWAGCVQGGPTLRYLVLFSEGTASADARTQISAACGATTIYYSQIAVAVATSADPDFGQRMGPDRAYSASAEAYTADQATDDAGRKSDELPDDQRSGVTADPAAVPTRDLAGQQWDMAMIKAGQAHDVDEGSDKVLVGVLDSGVDPDQPNLSGALDKSASAGCVSGAPDTTESAWVPTTSSHGTHVAGTIAATDDGKGISGVAPGVRVASVKVVDDDGYIYPEAAVCGFMWAAQQGMRVANNSYFVDPWVFTCDDSPGQHVIYQAVRRAVTYATRHGVLSIAAAGNADVDLTDPGQDGRSPDNVDTDDQEQRQLGDDCAQLPAGIPGVVTVSAVGADGLKASYSSYGLGAVDVTAPGGDPLQQAADGARCVLSTVPGGYASSCGTSMAAPHASGVAALLASTHPDATPKELTQLLDSEADPIACPADYDLNGTGAQDAYCTGDSTFNSFYGHGLVDALAAVRSVPPATKAEAPQAPPKKAPPVVRPAHGPAGPSGSTDAPSKTDGTDTTSDQPTTTPTVPVRAPRAATVPQAPDVTPAGGPIGGFALLGMW